MTRFFSLLALVILAAPLRAQGTLSTQGFGYHPGQLSTRARAAGGALGEFDPTSALNPAALAWWERSGVMLEYAPEFRRVTTAEGSESATIARFPLSSVALAIGNRTIVGITLSTFLDRTWETVQRDTQQFGDDAVPYELDFRSSGAINDIRIGGAWTAVAALRIGLGAHVYAGSNRLDILTRFDDTLNRIADFRQQSRISYSGAAVSAGIDWRPRRSVGLAVSGRLGGTLRAVRNDTTLARADVPSRLGVGLAYTGLTGTVIAASASWQNWSKLDRLGSSQLTTFDGWDYGLGAEVRGPRWFGADVPLRVGVRRRTLPFGAAGAEVRETSVAFGAGLALAGGRAVADLGFSRAARSADGDASERASTFSIGLTVRP
ncbi:MAG: hypothetical protein ACT4PJ_10240 [Gemmatimonadaceae bacterium]